MLKNGLWLFIITIFILILFIPTYTKLQDLRERNRTYEHQISRLEWENTRLLEEKRRLIEDPVYLEKVAREKMGLVKDGEVVYKLMQVQE